MSTHAQSPASKYLINGQSVKEQASMSNSEVVEIKSKEVREILRFLYYLDILKKLLLLQPKLSEYMYAKCLKFPCFINKSLAGCVHAFCMFYLNVSLGTVLPVQILGE